MRVNRALDKLRDALSKHGVTSTGLALAVVLTRDAIAATPAHLAARVASTAMTGAANASGLDFLLTSKIKLALAGFVLAAAAVAVFNLRHSHAETSREFIEPIAQTNVAAPVAPVMPRMEAAPMGNDMNERRLHLQIVTADSSQPIPFVPIQYFNWHDDSFHVQRTTQRTLTTDRVGVCDVRYPSNFTRLELIVGKEPFADTRLLWQKPLSDVVPSDYILRVERAVTIGGTVVDSEGTPVSGAKVTWKLNAPSLSESKPPPEHEYYGTEYETITDLAGHWEIRRIAGAIIPYLVGQAVESNYVDSTETFTSRDKSAVSDLRDGNYVFKLNQAATARGVVIDAQGNPIPNAEIFVGNRPGRSGSDGRFAVQGCQPERQVILAEADGFAATIMEVDLRQDSTFVRLIMRPGKLLRLKIVDAEGHAIANAFVNVVPDDKRYFTDFGIHNPIQNWSDSEGRVSWTNAPDTDVRLNVSAAGYPATLSEKIHPDGNEHVITLSQGSP